MYHAIKISRDVEGNETGFYASAHETEEMPACWQSPTVASPAAAIEASGVPAEYWKSPDEEDGETVAIANA